MRAHSKGCAKISSGKALPASLLMVPVASPALITAAMGLLSTLKRVQVKAADADAQACDVPAVDNGVAPAATHLRAAIGGEELWARGYDSRALSPRRRQSRTLGARKLSSNPTRRHSRDSKAYSGRLSSSSIGNDWPV